MLFSWNIPPSPSPTESKRLFYTSVSLFLFCIYSTPFRKKTFSWSTLPVSCGLLPSLCSKSPWKNCLPLLTHSDSVSPSCLFNTLQADSSLNHFTESALDTDFCSATSDGQVSVSLLLCKQPLTHMSFSLKNLLYLTVRLFSAQYFPHFFWPISPFFLSHLDFAVLSPPPGLNSCSSSLLCPDSHQHLYYIVSVHGYEYALYVRTPTSMSPLRIFHLTSRTRGKVY